MTIAHDLYLEACCRGLRVEPRGEKLALIPKGKCPPDLAIRLHQQKHNLLDWLSQSHLPGVQAVPPDDLSISTEMPHPIPSDRERVIAHLLRQVYHCPGSLTAWLVKREDYYYEGPGRQWDCAMHAYAAARDAACWQLGLSEAEVWQLLAMFCLD